MTDRRRGYAAVAGVVLLAVMATSWIARAPVETPGAAGPAAAAVDEGGGAPGAAGERAAATVAANADAADAAASADSVVAIGTAASDPFAYGPIADGVPRQAKPAVVRGIYLNAWAIGSPRKLARLIDAAQATEINAFVMDVKEGGEVTYRSSVGLAREIGADRDYVRDIRGVLRLLRENGIYPIARIVVFKDETLARARPEWAVQKEDGSLWRDGAGSPWVDSYHRAVWDYNIALAREALDLGFSEVQWDYVRFPDVPRALMATARWPAREGRSKADAIREFLLYSREALRDYGVPVTADVFGLTTSVSDDLGIGQDWDRMVDATDVLLPMVYPSHYARGTYGIAVPNANPRETVLRALRDGVRRSSGVSDAAMIRPWLQDFTLGAPRYGPRHVRAQIDAVYEAGLQEWVLWNPGSNYTFAALAAADGTPPRLGDLPPVVDTTSAAPRDTVRVRPLGRPLPDTTDALARQSYTTAVTTAPGAV